MDLPFNLWTDAMDESLMTGVAARFLALVYLVHFLSALPQLKSLIGKDGIEPVSKLFTTARRDLGVLGGLIRFPSLFWLSTSDVMLLAVPVLGALASLGIASGLLGAYTWLGFLAVWVCALSLQNANTNLFWFPWDNLLTETALLGVLCPALEPLPSLGAAAPASPILLLLVSWLMFRVMFGMGLAKFRRWDDRTRAGTYLYHFLEWQPFPCVPAAMLRELPMWMHKVGLAGFWCTEMVLPFLIFSSPELRALAGVVFIILQVVIWWTGNFGTFNFLGIGLSLFLLIPLEPTLVYESMTQPTVLSGLAWVYILGSIPFLLVTTTWTGASWMYRPSMYQAPAIFRVPMRAYLAFLRLVAPLRFWNSYGVFIPRGNVPHQVAVLQATHDGETWFDLEPKWLSCDVKRPPPRFAPHHPRLDHWLFYQGFGLASLRVACLSGMNPYYIHPHCLTEKLIQKLLHGDSNAWSLLRAGKKPDNLPRAIRHSSWHYHLTSRKEREQTGNWWNRELIAVGPPIYANPASEGSGIRAPFDALVLDRLALVDDVVLCVASKDHSHFEMLNAYPVQKLGGQKVARSRSVIESITHASSSEGATVYSWSGSGFEPVEVKDMVQHDASNEAEDTSRDRQSIWRRA